MKTIVITYDAWSYGEDHPELGETCFALEVSDLWARSICDEFADSGCCRNYDRIEDMLRLVEHLRFRSYAGRSIKDIRIKEG